MLPETYTSTIKEMRNYYRSLEESQLKSAVSAAEGFRKSNDDYAARITEITAQYLETGVFFLKSHWEGIPKTSRTHGQWYTTTMATYCRSLAKSLKRPFIRLQGDTLLTVPKQKRLDVLTVPLMFIAQKPETPWRINGPGVWEPARHTSLREYFFNGEEGKAQLQMWLEYIKSPECRKAMGIN
jgi:hypothetical protein